MSDRLDGCLDAGQAEELDAHLAGCEACRREWEELRQTVALIRGLPQVAPPGDLVSSVRQSLARRRKSPLVVFWRVLSLPETRVAVAAALVIVLGVYGWRSRLVNPDGVEGLAIQPRRATSVPRPVVPVDIVPFSENEAAATAAAPATDKDVVMPPPTAAAPKPSADANLRKDGMWRDDEGKDAQSDSSKPILGLSVGDADHAEAEDKLSRLEESSAPAGVGRAAPAVVSYAIRAKKEEARRNQAVREIVLAEGDAEVVRKIMAPYMVRADGKDDTRASEVRERSLATQVSKAVASAPVVSGWIRGADYGRLLAALQAAAAITPLTDVSVVTNGADTNLVFVCITIAPP